MRAHGSGRACYSGERLPAGSCDECRKYQRTRLRIINARYKKTAKGMIAISRHNAKERQG